MLKNHLVIKSFRGAAFIGLKAAGLFALGITAIQLEAGASVRGAVALEALGSPSTIQTRIARVIEPVSSGDDFEVYSTVDGRVYKVKQENTELLKSLAAARNDDRPVELHLDGDQVSALRKLSSVESATYHDDLSQQAGFLPASFGDYEPTQFSSFSEAQSLYNTMHRRFSGGFFSHSQCYQRAEVWSHDLYRQQGVKTMKVFLFFSNRYRKEVPKEKWWFHVAPFTYVNGTQYVLDPIECYNCSRPATMREWSDVQIVLHAPCREVSSYQEYERLNQGWGDYCYLRKVPMYYYQPRDVEALDESRAVQSSFRSEDLHHAYSAKK